MYKIMRDKRIIWYQFYHFIGCSSSFYYSTPLEKKVGVYIATYPWHKIHSSNLTSNERPKYAYRDCLFVREYGRSSFLNLIHVISKQQLTGPLTKNLP